MQTWKHVFVALCAVPLTACTADVDGSEVEEEVGTAEQAEVFGCPQFTAAQLQSVKVNQELLITAASANPAESVVDDACRTTWSAACSTSTKGKWTFWNLVTQMAGSNNSSRFVLKWLESFEEMPVVNGQTLSSRSKIRTHVIDPWRAASGCANGAGQKYDSSPCNLDGSKAPFRLLAIVNRMDLRNAGDVSSPYGGGSAGEGRLVFGFIKQDGTSLQGTAVFEYKLPTAQWNPLTWATKWRALGANFASINESYKANLQIMTDKFVNANAITGNPNLGSAINQVRVNEIDFDPASNANRRWAFREYKLGCLPNTACSLNDKFLVNVPVAQTPADSALTTSRLTTFMNNNRASILGETHQIPLTFEGAPFQGGESKAKPFLQGGFFWDADTMLTPETTHNDVRRFFAIGTCNGCHYIETETNNFHVFPRNPGFASALSPFLSTAPTGTPLTVTNVWDSTDTNIQLNEPRRRVCEHLWLVNGNSTPLTTTAGRAH